MVKLIMTWNIREGKESEYLDFLTQDFAKALADMGIQPSDAWYAVWGEGPQVLAGGLAEDLEQMEKALASAEWQAFRQRRHVLVVDLDHKVVEAKKGFQI